MKVLIISHNPVSTYNNMGKTLKALFSSFKKEELCQLYVYPTYPDVDMCSSYYRITDRDVLNSFLRFDMPGATFRLEKNIVSKENVDSNLSMLNHKKNSVPIKRLVRDMMWKFSRWNSPQLKKWIEDENPTCIFLAPGYAKFIYDIALVISKQYHIPIITYICDDYYFLSKPKTIIGKIQYKLLQKKTDELMKQTTHLVSICEEVNELYSKKFEIPSTVIMTGSEFEQVPHKIKKTDSRVISYFGNIGCKRYISLAEIGKSLDQINQENGTQHILKIYCGKCDLQILEAFQGIESIQLCNFISGDEFIKIFTSSELLLHVEGFEKDSIELVKNSISTKIPDSLSVGIPLIAYGPDTVASIKYLKKNNCAYVITKKEELNFRLREILINNDNEKYVIDRALEIAAKNHNSLNNSRIVKQICESKSIKLMNLDQIKVCEKQILKYFKEYCNNNGIHYYLSNGTLLGAVKYQGFIPWDDDIDILINRNDYDFLMKSYQDNERYKLFSYERNKNFKYPFAKLCDMYTRKQEHNIDNGIELGLDIDIFPLDSWPADKIIAEKKAKRILKYISILNLAKLNSSKGKSFIRSCVKKFCIVLSRGIGTDNIICKIQKLAVAEKNYVNSNYVGCVVWPIYGAKEIIPIDVFKSAIEVEFEGRKYPAPIGYDTYLRSLYGDYENDPPLEMQKTHHNFKAYRIDNN